MLNRRTFLKGTALGAGLGSGVGAFLLGEGRARAAFGDVPAGSASATVPEALQCESILEIFLYGGVSQYESFYCIPEYGADNDTGWSLFLNSGDVEAALDACGVTGPLTEPFAPDANGKMVQLGPFVMPIRNRPDVMNRMRVSITQHLYEPHEGAIPLALGGRALGDQSLAGLGAHIQRYFLDHGGSAARAPFSYVLRSEDPGFPSDNISAATAVGLHPGAARPLEICIDAAGDLTTMLKRGTVGSDRAAYDSAMQQYIQAYGQRLAWKGKGAPTRAPELTDLASGASEIHNAGAIQGVLNSSYFDIVQGTECGDTNEDATTMSLRLATHLLTDTTTPARYACVIDGGLMMADGGGGYDTHIENSHTQARNLGHTLKCLMSLINEPGEKNPAKLDLDKTMILLTTEFGRTPTAQDGTKGRNHWPYGFPVMSIGGPIRKPGVYGACGPNASYTLASSPQENRMAALMALGIWPFAPESFGVSDVPMASTMMQAAALVKRNQLGLT